MIPIIIPGSVVKAAADGVKALDDKATGGAAQAKKRELSQSASKTAAEKKKKAEESETGKAVAAKAAAASAALDEGLGKFGAWRRQKASELEAAFDEFRGATGARGALSALHGCTSHDVPLAARSDRSAGRASTQLSTGGALLSGFHQPALPADGGAARAERGGPSRHPDWHSV